VQMEKFRNIKYIVFLSMIQIVVHFRVNLSYSIYKLPFVPDLLILR
jgi:hypothetical protein